MVIDAAFLEAVTTIQADVAANGWPEVRFMPASGSNLMIVGQRRDRSPVFARDLKAQGPMTVLLKDAIAPNLVQTIENNPAFIHGGPFANIAHGCSSVIATKLSTRLSEYTVTEAGFGADLGAEKFMNIKCRKAGLAPDCVVIVATVLAGAGLAACLVPIRRAMGVDPALAMKAD